MIDRATEIKNLLEQKNKYQETLFIRGYLVTSRNFENTDDYPFYNNWLSVPCGVLDKININIYYHKLQDCFTYEKDEITAAIIGHAYNPFDMKFDEVEILKDCIDAYQHNRETFFDKISELTGIHLIILNDGVNLIVVQDCAGMKSCNFGKVEDDFFITSHPQLIADIYGLEMDPFVKRLVSSKSYNITNRYLPGNITPCKELKRLGGNTFIEYKDKFKVKRFYPTKPHDEIKTKEQFDESIKKIYDIMHSNIELTSRKWDRPTISLSGGTDSKTTLACANGLYDKFTFFSFHCKPQELIDANAAHKICGEIGLEHVIYPIPENNDEVEDFNMLKKIINHNTSYCKNTADHEIRKMIFLYRLNDFEIELKSWTSEIGRCSLERRYGIKMPKKLSARHLSIFQTRYFMTPFLLAKSDKIYKRFLKEIGLEEPLYNFEHADLFHWEVRLGSWGTSVVTSLDLCHNVTMPYNNRKLIELFLTFTHDDRRDGVVHDSVTRYGNKSIDALNITIKNKHSSSYRQKAEQIYYYYRTLFR